MNPSFLSFLLLVSLGLLVGCGPDEVVAPSLDPAAAAVAAIAEYDTNSDGKISTKEAKLSALNPKSGWDADGDGAISEEEIVARMERYESLKPGIQALTCSVQFRGDYLDNAKIVFEPEAFLGGAVEQAEGTTDGYGQAEINAPAIAEAANDPTLRGVRCGLYKIRITHPDIDIHKRYNENTMLFFELSPMDNVLMPTFNLH